MIKGHVDLSWLSEREYYITQFIEETNTVWASGYWHDNNLAVPDYPYESPIIHQTYDNYAPGWAHRISSIFNWIDYKMVTVNCVKPGRMIPPHKDAYFRLFELAKKNNFDIKGKEPIRVNVFLQDFEVGHFLQIGDTVYSHYKKGDYTFIETKDVHTVSNTSNNNRYTLQVTGFTEKENIK